MRRCLVGNRVGADAAPDHFGQDFGGIAEQADAGRLGGGGDDLQRLVDAGRAMVDVAGLEALLDPAILHLDRDAVRPGHDRGERLSAAHAAKPGGQDPFPLEVAAEMLAAHFGECFVSALDDALAADVDP